MTFRRLDLAAPVLVLALVAAGPAGAGTWRVGVNAGDCPGGCNWSCQNVPTCGDQIAVAMLSPEVLPGDTVMVWPGTYGVHSVTMKSGIVLISAQGPANTIIQGGRTAEGAITYVGMDANSAVLGFTFTWDAGENGLGGGIAAYVSSGKIQNNVFVSNSAGIGSGLYLQACDLTLSNNLFVNNSCAAGGGTIAISGGAPTIRRNTFSGSSAPFGFEGATLYSNGSDFVFDRNIVQGSLGASAVFCGSGNHPSLSCNIFWQNALGAFAGQCVDSVGTSGNVAQDPRFCNPSARNFGFCADSPALTGPCGAIGYASPGGNCPACIPTAASATMELATWGRLKAAYR
ncbi:MAG: hypothetical protein U0167_01825 [bacterium]